MLNCYEVLPNVVAIKDRNVWMYLIKGSKKAVLLDSGFGDKDLPDTLKVLYDGSIMLCHTHAHIDHIGGDSFFDEIYAAKEEIPVIRDYLQGQSCNIKQLQHGDIINLGDCCLEIIHLPGHTPGALGFLDREARVLFAGDYISERTIYMCLNGVDFELYKESLRWIIDNQKWYDTILGFHGESKQSLVRAQKLMKCIELYERGCIVAEEATIYTGEIVKKISYEEVSIFI